MSSRARSSKPVRRGQWGGRWLRVGVALGFVGVALTMSPPPGGHNLFGPPKLAMLALAASCVWVGFALAPERLSAVARTVRTSHAAWAWAAFVGLVLLSTATSVSVSQSIVGGYPEYAGVVRLALVLSVAVGSMTLLAEDPSMRSLSRAVTTGLAIIVVYAIAQRFGIDFVNYRAGLDLSRVRSTLGNASNLGVYLVATLPFAVLMLSRDSNRRWRAVGLAVAVAGLLALVLTDSRGAWVGALLGVIAFVALRAAAPSARGSRKAGAGRRRRYLIWVAGAFLVTFLLVEAVVIAVPSTLGKAQAVLTSRSGTVSWRIAAWGSAARMAVDRPLLGWGPGSFRFVYPRYRALNAEENLRVGRETADAHNVIANTAATLGFPAVLALLFSAGLTGIAVVRWNRGDSDSAAAFLGAGLASATGALMFHFPTMDTAPVIGVLIGTAIASEAVAGMVGSQRSSVAPAHGAARTWAIVASVVVFAVLVASLGLVGADIYTARGLAMASAGAPWAETSKQLDRARALAPWEPMFVWASGRAGADSVRTTHNRVALEEGLRFIRNAERLLPLELGVTADEGNLHLIGGMTFNQAGEFKEALRCFNVTLAFDPNNSQYWVGRATALAGLGEWDSAARSFERAISLTPRSRAAWEGAAVAYEALGQKESASRAREKAQRLPPS